MTPNDDEIQLNRDVGNSLGMVVANNEGVDASEKVMEEMSSGDESILGVGLTLIAVPEEE